MERMSINAHPEIVPPVLYVPVDERADGGSVFHLPICSIKPQYFWHTHLLTDCLTEWVTTKAGLLSK